VAFSDDAANTTTVPEMLGVATAAGAELAGALLDGALLEGALLEGALLERAGAADDGADAAFFDELQPARPSATTTAVTRTADAWRFIDSPRSGWGRRLTGVRY
jgi:hypothetical protein